MASLKKIKIKLHYYIKTLIERKINNAKNFKLYEESY